MKKILLAILLCLTAALLCACGGKTLTVAEKRSTEYNIVTDGEDKVAVAAAEYMANAIGSKFDVEMSLFYSSENVGRVIILKSDEALTEEYTVNVEETNIVITVADANNLFNAVKAITDKWLAEGIDKNGSLIINGDVIATLSALDTVITDSVKILSQNVRYANDPDGNSIAERGPRFMKLIEQYKPDLIGTQETSEPWMTFLTENLGDVYGMVGCSRKGKLATDGEWNTVLYRKDRFELIEGDTFWLSKTPDVEGSMLDYDGSIRICTWTLLKDKVTGKIFMFNNTHLQNGGEYEDIREQQVNILFEALVDNVGYFYMYPSFLTGDFNATRTGNAYTTASEWMNDAALSAFEDRSTVNYTYHGYTEQTDEYVIDYCFHSLGDTFILDYEILDDKYDGYVSDHYGVLVTAVIG